jgi:hypothetical protein
MERNSFVFYRSFYEALKTLPQDDKAKIYEAIIAYGLDGTPPSLEGYLASLFTLIKPQIDANNKKFENGKSGGEHGKKGGRPPKNNPTETPQKPLNNPTETPNANANANANEECHITDFQKVYELGSSLYPKLAVANSYEITKWLENDCDLEKDILPEINKHIGKQIGGWSYFTGAIAQAKANRLTPMPQPKGSQNATNINSPYGNNQPTKTDRLKAAAMRAAIAGGFAPITASQGATNDNPLSVFPVS